MSWISKITPRGKRERGGACYVVKKKKVASARAEMEKNDLERQKFMLKLEY